MIKLAAFGLLGFLIVLILPANAVEQTPSFLYGAATIVAHDAYGNEVFSQTVHNQLFDQGEDFLINQAFTNLGGGPTADATQIGAICLSAAAASVTESDDNTAFNTAHDLADNGPLDLSQNCRTDPLIAAAPAQIVTIGPLTFTADAAEGANWFATDTVLHIGICDAESLNADIRGCTTTLFAVVNTSDVTLADTETVDVTYTFDLSSGGS